MDRVAFCPDCGSDQPHRFAADELETVLWCRTCSGVHPEVVTEESCDECHFWHLDQCWHASSMLGGPRQGGGQCQFRRGRRAIPEPPIDF